jgi:hypothetical protein
MVSIKYQASCIELRLMMDQMNFYGGKKKFHWYETTMAIKFGIFIVIGIAPFLSIEKGSARPA